IIDEKILCVHGGLSPDIKTLDQIRLLERNQEIPHKGAFCDLVWSDPQEVETWTELKNLLTETWPEVFDSELFPDDFMVFRKDWNLDATGKTRGG
ncbi:hypothetical protein NQ317_016282, partial [Molorchus minor]